MYIWIGVKLPEEFETTIRSRCLPLGQELGLDLSGFTLPQHISLKISFQAESRYEEILAFVEDLMGKEFAFYVNPETPRRQGNILWLPFHANGHLRHLHELLDAQLQSRFDIGQHPFDREFFFHSTLLMGEAAPLSRAEAALANLSLPEKLEIDTVLLGISETGESGTYRVVRQFPLAIPSKPNQNR